MLLLPEDGSPLYLNLYRQLRAQIETGERKAGEKLPSKRAMASQLGISVNTVDAAYAQLLSEGFVEARPRSGYYIQHIGRLQRLTPPPCETVSPAASDDGVRVDFAPGDVDREKFPFTIWNRLLKSALDDPSSLHRAEAQGDPGLRRAAAAYLHNARGVNCSPEQIVIGAGTDSLLSLLSYLLPSHCAAAVENPVYNKAYRLFARMGHTVLPAEIDRQGVMVEPLENLTDVLLYTTPSHQYPLGLSMPMGRRVKLLNWAGRGGSRYILEDDYDSEFRYDARPVPSLQGIDKNGRTIYLGTFSRSIAPSIRVSYLVLPPLLLDLYRREYTGFACAVSTLEQIALREFLLKGYFETHLNRMRVCYRAKRARLLDGLAPLEGQIRCIGEAAGCHLTLQARNGLSETELCRLALSAGVRVYPVSPFFMGKCPYDGKVLLGFGGLSETQLREGTEALCKAWHV